MEKISLLRRDAAKLLASQRSQKHGQRSPYFLLSGRIQNINIFVHIHEAIFFSSHRWAEIVGT